MNNSKCDRNINEVRLQCADYWNTGCVHTSEILDATQRIYDNCSDKNAFCTESDNHNDQWWWSYHAFIYKAKYRWICKSKLKPLETVIADANRLLVFGCCQYYGTKFISTTCEQCSFEFFMFWTVLLPFISIAFLNAVKVDTYKNVRISNAGGVTTPKSIFTFSLTIQLTMEKYFPFTKCFFVLSFTPRISAFVYKHKHLFTCFVDALNRFQVWFA